MNILEQASRAAGAARQGPKVLQPGDRSLGKNDFLKLLTTQMQAQDPLNPMDNTEFVAQLTQFTSLERLENMSSTMEQVAMSTAANTSAQMVSFIGKDVSVASDKVSLGEDGAKPVTLDLAAEAETTQITIRDDAGRVVRTVELGRQSAGEQEWTWDGKSDDGAPLEPGTYTFEVKARDAEEATVAVSTRTQHEVQGVTFEGGYPQLVLEGDTRVGLGDVHRVSK